MTNFKLNFNLEKENLDLVNQRITEFENLYKNNNDSWFSELCFCILTANSQAKKAIAIQNELGANGFLTKTQEELAQVIRSHNHRFHNNKAKYIVEARKFKNIKDLLINLTGPQAREFIVRNIKGLGFKEASHFLRNVGYNSVAIIDRHILRFLFQNHFIDAIPKTVTPKKYIEYENILKNFNMRLDKLDLLIWCHITGTVLK